MKVIEVSFFPKDNAPQFSVLVLTNNHKEAEEAAVKELNAEGLDRDQYTFTVLAEKTIIRMKNNNRG